METNNRFALSEKIVAVINKLRKETSGMVEPMSFSIIQNYGRDPFLVLISGILSTRTKDSVTLPASLRLFSLATTAEHISALDQKSLEQAIYPVGFYRQKAVSIKKTCMILSAQYEGAVPADFHALVSLPGVGPKVANLVLAVGFGIPAICVDVHVHRICNRLGLVSTKTPEETEQELKKIIPKEYWIELNRLLVMWGQNVCVPISPYCSRCVIQDVCSRKGVTRYR